MKKNLIMSLVVAGMMGLMLTGCGKGAPEKVTVEVEPTVEATTEVANPEEQPLIDEEPTVTPAEPITETATDDTVEVEIIEDGTTVSDEQVEVGDYLTENGITITPQGTHVMQIAYNNSDETHEKTVEVTVETVPSDEEGYVDTIYTTKWDVGSTGQNFLYTFNAYDRYSGYALTEPSEDVTFLSDGGTETNTFVLDVDGVKYNVSYTDVWDTSDPNTWVGTLTIHHPVEYNGVVFSLGSASASRNAFNCTEHQSCKLGAHPEWSGNDLYFTATNN